MELTTELKTALWQIANLAMDCHDNKLNGEQFEQAAFDALNQVENIAYESTLASRRFRLLGVLHGKKHIKEIIATNKETAEADFKLLYPNLLLIRSTEIEYNEY